MNNSFNKKELKNISRKFRTVSSRIVNCDFEDFDNNLKRLISFIDGEEVIKDYIDNCIEIGKIFNIEEEVKEVSSNYGQVIFDSYLEEKEEVSYIYQILKYITDHNINCRAYIMGYAHSNKYQDMVEGFGERFLVPFINYIDGYFERIFTEMGFDENNNYNITINGGQVNISKDNSILNAVQNSNNESICKLIDELKKILDSNNVEQDIKEEIIDNAEGIQEELMRDVPRKGRLKSFAEGLRKSAKLVPEIVGLAANIATIISFLQPFI